MPNFKKHGGLILLVSLFTFYTIWWLLINLGFLESEDLANYFTDSYGLIAAVGGVAAFFVSKKWGLFKSTFGRALALFSIVLFFQFLGQLSYAIYYYVYHIENPYPSFGEVFYFGSIPITIYAIWLLGKAIGVSKSLKSPAMKTISIIVPLTMMLISYKVFLTNYDFTDVSPLTIFLDFGYPLGEAIFIAFAFVAYWLSRSQLGGLLKKNVILLFMSLILQYSADTIFLVNTMNDTWRPAGLDDYLFLLAYFAMGAALYSFSFAADKLSRKG
jgi:hypothetical protein